MRKLFLLVVVLGISICMTARAADDPGQTYADAFILEQDAQNAEANSDFATAAAKYRSAADMLRGIRANNPDWNVQVVEYRLKDVNTRLDAIKDKAPGAAVTTAPATEAPAPAPGSLAVEFATPQATSRLRSEVDRLKEENAKLSTELDAARKAPVAVVPNKQVDQLKQQNKQLNDQLAEAKRQLATKPAVDTAETKKLRDELARTRSELDSAKKANTQLADLQRQNKELQARLANAQKAATAPSESADLKKLRAELNKARDEADQAKAALAKAEAASKERADIGKQLADLEKQNATLRSQLAAAKSAPPPPVPAPVVESAELKKLRTDLASARGELEKSRAANQQQVADLQRQNKDLAAKLATAKAPAPASESAELKKLRADLATARAETGKAKGDAARLERLEKQNKDLTAQLAAKPGTSSADAEVKKLRADLANARAEADKAKQANTQVAGLEQENKYLAAQLAAAKSAPKQNYATTAATPASSQELASLQKQNADLKAMVADAQRRAAAPSALSTQNKELTGKLSASQQRVADLEKQVAAKSTTAPANSAEMNKLRADLAAAQKASAQADAAAKQNQQLSSQLAASQKRVTDLEKQVAGRSAAPADSAQMKALQAELANARVELDRTKKASANATALVQQNQQLSSQLAAAKSQSAELQQTRAELAAAQAEAQNAQAASARAAELEKQNNELAEQLESAKKGPYIRPLSTEESAQIRQMRTELDDMHAEVSRAQSANARLEDLEKQNVELKAQLEDSRKNAITKVEVVDMNPPGRQIAPPALSQKDAATMKKLRDENSYMRNLLETYAAKNPELKPRLKKYQTSSTTNAPTATTSK